MTTNTQRRTLTEEQRALLNRFTNAYRQAEKARERAEGAAADAQDAYLTAVEAGVPQARLTAAAGISKMTGYRLLRRAES
jgi:vacuolar-type H+-ATPase subunit D/Vma8